jgi:ligand-binding sensor domain-containing protein
VRQLINKDAIPRSVKTLVLHWAVMMILHTVIHAQDRYYYNVQSFDSKDGFKPYLQTNHITQSRDGLIWIGSTSGLYSFDGRYFQLYTIQPKIKSSLPLNIVSFNYEDKDGRYWVYVFNKGLYNYDPRTEGYTKVMAANQREFDIHQFQINRPFEDNNNNIWFPIFPYGIAKYDKAANTFTPYRIYPPETKDIYRSIAWINNIVKSPDDNTFWMASNGGLIHFNPADGKYTVFVDKDFLLRRPDEASTYVSACFDANKDLWIGTWGQGLKKFDRKSQIFSTFLPYPQEIYGTKNICNNLAVRDKNTLWISSLDQGLLIFDKIRRRFVPVFDDLTMQPVKNTSSFYQAPDGDIWFCSDKKLQTIHVNKTIFSFYPFFDSLAQDKSIGFAAGFIRNNGILYIGAYSDGGFYRYDLSDYSYRKYALPRGLLKYEVNAMTNPGKGDIWLATTAGTYVFNTAKDRITRPPVIAGDTGCFGYPAFCIAADKTGGIWVSTSKGLFYYNRIARSATQYSSHIQGGCHLQTNYIQAIFPDKDNNIWIGMHRYGIACKRHYDSSFHLLNSIAPADSLEQNCLSICQSDDGSLVYSIEGAGISVLSAPFTNLQNSRIYNSASGLLSDKILDVMKDSKSRLWGLSEAGLFLLDTRSGGIINFTDADGLINCADGSLSQTEDGNIYTGRANGFQVFNPDSLLAIPLPPARIHISQFEVNNVAYRRDGLLFDGTDTVHLQPDQRNIRLQFAAVSTSFSGVIRYAYRLLGYDKEWLHNNNVNSIVYTNLPSGKYQLQIRTGNCRGQWNSLFLSIPIVIATPWYDQWWFRTLCVIAGLLIVYGVYRIRIKNIRREANLMASYNKRLSEMEMKALRAQMNPHFIFNCLNSINRYIVRSDEKTASNYLTKFSKLIRLILDNSASETISLEKEMETLKLYIEMESLRFDHVFDYTIHIAEDIDAEQTEIPSMIIQPYIENAIWHGLLHKESGRGLLQVNIFMHSDNLLIAEVTDNGIGRIKAAEIRNSETLKRKSYGIQLSKERLLLINNILDMNADVRIVDLQDEYGQSLGTRAIIEIPLKYDA